MEHSGASFKEYREPPKYDEDESDEGSGAKIVDLSSGEEESNENNGETKIEKKNEVPGVTSLTELLEFMRRSEENRKEDFKKLEETRKDDQRMLAEEFKKLEENRKDEQRKLAEEFKKLEENRKEDFKKLEENRKDEQRKLAEEFKEGQRQSDERFARMIKEMRECLTNEQEERQKLKVGLEEYVGEKLEELEGAVGERIGDVKREINVNLECHVESLKEMSKEEVKAVREQVEIIARNVREKDVEQEKKINDLAGKVEGIRLMRAGGAASPTSFPNPPHNLGFRGRPHEHPVAFMRGVENYFSIHVIPHEVRSRFFYQMLDEGAKGWADTIFPFPENMEEFRQLFYSRYWGKEQRINYKIRVMSGTYRRTPGNNMQEYATRKIAAIRLCEPPENEEEIVALLIRQFPPYAQDLLRSAEVTTYERLLTMLGRFDQSQIQMGRPEETSPNVNAIQNRTPRGSRWWERGGNRDREWQPNGVNTENSRNRDENITHQSVPNTLPPHSPSGNSQSLG
jgi:hypothetical protein